MLPLDKLVKIEIVFENLEYVSVSSWHDLQIGDIEARLTIIRQTQQKHVDWIASNARLAFDLKYVEPTGMFDMDQTFDPVETLRRNDVSHLDLHYADGTHKYIAMPWDPTDEYTNLMQTTMFSDDGQSVVLSFN